MVAPTVNNTESVLDISGISFESVGEEGEMLLNELIVDNEETVGEDNNNNVDNVGIWSGGGGRWRRLEEEFESESEEESDSDSEDEEEEEEESHNAIFRNERDQMNMINSLLDTGLRREIRAMNDDEYNQWLNMAAHALIFPDRYRNNMNVSGTVRRFVQNYDIRMNEERNLDRLREEREFEEPVNNWYNFGQINNNVGNRIRAI